MKDFNFKIPQNIQFGMGSLKKLPEILTESRSDKILLVSDRGLEKIGVVKKVQDIIETAGLQCTSYLDVVPNPTMAVVNEAADLYRKCGATSIVALGGGSSMDVGKAVVAIQIQMIKFLSHKHTSTSLSMHTAMTLRRKLLSTDSSALLLYMLS